MKAIIFLALAISAYTYGGQSVWIPLEYQSFSRIDQVHTKCDYNSANGAFPISIVIKSHFGMGSQVCPRSIEFNPNLGMWR